MAGRPSVYREDLFKEALNRISEGESLKSICEDAHMPNRSSIMKWLSESQDLSDKYARAKERCADKWFEELREHADNAVKDHAKTQAYKLKIDTDKWILARMAPRKYGELGDITEKRQQRPKFPFEEVDTQDLRESAKTPERFFS